MINKVILIGRAGRDPEVRHLDNNLVMARFSLATDEFYRTKEGERATRTEWHNIVMWRQLAETAEKYVRKGSLLYIEGRLRNRTWEKDGTKHYAVDIEAETMRFIGSRPDGQSSTSSLEPTTDVPMPPIGGPDLEPVTDDLPF